MRLLSILLVALLFAFADVPADDGPIRAEGSLWAKYYKAGDLESLMTLYTDDVVVALHGQPALFGKAAVREYFSTRIGKADTEFELDYEVVRVEGDTAWIVSKYWLVAVDRETGSEYRDAGRSMLVYRRKPSAAGGGEGDDEVRWLIAADLDQATPDVGWPSPNGLQ